ncbi:anti-sigma factor family protein [Paenibacillus endoradicis]|uniref:anti-sigma factor family protein n=1 Tax=Paenibacillus endoradicis TaxID=2972487 RepID=UPI0021591E4B|nr:zf-HC2 domain-containing protein [Paenibacillus endoradicis]MCR8659187.1 zf-HC2 domain-containing protein [Paenibacillus endoradicis]
MNCTEVGELMQRNLDYDLSELELETLMTHLSDCAQCTVLFEKLTLLSGSLEQLPRVTPSISIVDAILPELERIDKEKRNSLIVAKQRRTRWFTSVGSIATAAAIVVLMVNLNGIPATNNSSATDLAMKLNVENSTASEPTTDLFIASQEDAESEDALSPRLRASDSVEQYALESGSTHNYAQSDDVSDKNQGVESTAVAPTLPSIKKDSSTERPKDTLSTAFVPTLTGSLTEKVDKLGVLNELATTIQAQSGEAEEVNVQQYLSNDEKVYLKFEEHTISVYETSSNQIMKQWDLPQQGLFEFIEWDNEGKNFTFQVTDEAGQITSYTWKLIEQQ